MKTCWKIGYLNKEQLWKIQKKRKVVASHHFICADRAEWNDVMVIGSPRTLCMPEVTDTQSMFIQAPKPTKAMLSSKEGPTRHTTVNHITPQRTARKGKHKNWREVHFKVGNRVGMNTKKTLWEEKKEKEQSFFPIKIDRYVPALTCVIHDS